MHPTLLLLVLACGSSRPPTPSETPPTEVDAPAVEAPAERLELTLDPKYLSYDETKGIATFSPDSDRKSAAYTHYAIDLPSLEAVLGERPTDPIDVVLAVDSRQTETHTPDDPGLAAPDGGFQVTTVKAHLVAP